MCKSWCQSFSLGAHHYFDFKGHGSWVEFLATSCFVFVCLFVCFSTPKVGDYFVFKSHKWVRFSFFFVCVWVGVCVCVFCVVFPSKCSISPPYYLRSGWFFFFFFFFLSRRLVKFFAFFYFCLFVFILFCFVLFCFLFCFQKFHPLDIKWCALIILLHRWWWTLRHRQFWIPVQFSEKSNSNLKLH